MLPACQPEGEEDTLLRRTDSWLYSDVDVGYREAMSSPYCRLRDQIPFAGSGRVITHRANPCSCIRAPGLVRNLTEAF